MSLEPNATLFYRTRLLKGLTASQHQQYLEDGYVIVEDILDPVNDIAPIMEEYDQVLEKLARSLLQEGAISSDYGDLPFASRLIAISVETGRNFVQYFDINIPRWNVRPDSPCHFGSAIFRMLTHPHLLDIIEDLVGTEIYCNSIQHVRLKVPLHAVAKGNDNALEVRTPWHQDNGALDPEVDKTNMVTVWLAITESTVENGCLQVIPRVHYGDLYVHCPGTHMMEIPDHILPLHKAVPLPMHAGSALFMTKRTPHSSLENMTKDHVRISFDLRYQPIGQPSGIPELPGFAARSVAHPEKVLRDPEAWARSWYETRDRLALLTQQQGYVRKTNRWNPSHPTCLDR